MLRGFLQFSFQLFEVAMPEFVKSCNLSVLKEV
jgi:hypothetical protein